VLSVQEEAPRRCSFRSLEPRKSLLWRRRINSLSWATVEERLLLQGTSRSTLKVPLATAWSFISLKAPQQASKLGQSLLMAVSRRLLPLAPTTIKTSFLQTRALFTAVFLNQETMWLHHSAIHSFIPSKVQTATQDPWSTLFITHILRKRLLFIRAPLIRELLGQCRFYNTRHLLRQCLPKLPWAVLSHIPSHQETIVVSTLMVLLNTQKLKFISQAKFYSWPISQACNLLSNLIKW